MRQVETFDIFDTLLTRRVGNPRAAFLLLGQRLRSKALIDCSAEAFSRQRTGAEIRAFRNAGGLDSAVNLESIYNELRQSLGIDAALHSKLIAEELDLESDLLVPMSEGARRITEARSAGREVAFVSDMYLPSWFIRDQLVAHSLIKDGDVLIVSNEYAASKSTGALWPIVLNQLGVEATSVHHTGDNLKSDLKSPRRAGIRSTHVDAGNLNRFEEQLETFSYETDGLSSLLAGASRRVRTEMATRTDHERHIRDVAAGVVSPFIVGNILWILRQAAESEVENVFFIARDGQIMLDVARHLAPKVGYTGRLTYLLGSRSAWVLPSVTTLDMEVVSSAIPDGGDVDNLSLRRAIRRFGLEPEQLEQQLVDADLAPSMWDTTLTATQRQALRAALVSDGIRETILDLAADRRAVMLRYLKQAGAITSRPIAIVDQGTGSTLFNAMSSVLETIGQAPPRAFYFGLRRDAQDVGYGVPETYVRNEQDGSGFLKTPGLLTLVEMACTADHGSVMDYQDVDGDVTIDLTSERNGAVMDWGFGVLRSTVNATVRELCESPFELPRHVDLRPASISVFEMFWNKPTRAEAEAWGRYPFEDGWSSDSVSNPIAERQGIRAVGRPQPHRHWWNGGAQALSTPIPRTMLRGRSQAVEIARRVSRRLG